MNDNEKRDSAPITIVYDASSIRLIAPKPWWWRFASMDRRRHWLGGEL